MFIFAFTKPIGMKQQQFIAYYRVSTVRQGQSGLGLEAQQQAVSSYLGSNKPIAEYTDIESGKNNDRPGLIQAIQHCKNVNATLIIAKLDRLSRNVAFIANLQESRVKFICCDMPDATELTIHIFAALAQWERTRISERTKAALEALKKRGVKLGGSKQLNDADRNKAAESNKLRAESNPANIQAKAMIGLLRGAGKTLKECAGELNKAGFKTSTGKAFSPTQVSRLI